MTKIFTQYEDYLRDIMTNGREKSDRTGTGTKAVFGRQMRWDMADGFPLVGTKKVHIKSIVEELRWFLLGLSDNNWLKERGVTIWDEWAREDGDLGPVYGVQWRAWSGNPILQYPHESDGDPWVHQPKIDQIQIALDTLRKSPDSRRIIVSAWNVADLPKMALAPCHCLFQFNTELATEQERENYAYNNNMLSIELDGEGLSHHSLDVHRVPKYRLSLQMYQRSCDSFLGVPFNIASYAFLLHMFAQQVDMIPGDFIWTGGDCHIYSNHFEQVKEQLSRPIPMQPELKLRKAADLFSYQLEDFELVGYNPLPAIKAPVAV